MTYIFSKILSMSISASFVIVAVLVARLILKRAPKFFSYVLWAVVLFRLVCPFSPEVNLGIKFDVPDIQQRIQRAIEFGISNDNSDVSTHSESTVTVLEINAGDYGESKFMQQDIGADEKINPDFFSSLGETKLAKDTNNYTQNNREQNINALSDIMFYASFVWLAGAFAMIIYSLNSLIKIEEKLGSAHLLKDNIYLCDYIPTAFVFGIIRPKIYLPPSVKEKELKNIIEHEKHHIKRFDHIIKIVAYAALCVHWFNPLVWLAFSMFSCDMEMSCDEAVVRKSDLKERADYSQTLLTLATGGKRIPGYPLAFGEVGTKSRIKNVLSIKKSGAFKIVFSCIVCAIVLVSCTVTPDMASAKLDYLDYKAQIGLEKNSDGNLNVVHYPETDGNNGLISLMKINAQALTDFLSGLELQVTIPPSDSPTSENSVQIALETFRIDIYKHKNYVKVNFDGTEKWYIAKDKPYEKILDLLFDNTVLVSEKCLFMHPLSSFYPFGGDSGYRYIVSSDEFRIDTRNGGIISFPGVKESGWQRLPWDKTSWSELFVMTLSDVKMPDSFFEKAEYYCLSEQMGLIRYNGEIWFIELRENSQMGKYLWSIYTLVSEQYDFVKLGEQ